MLVDFALLVEPLPAGDPLSVSRERKLSSIPNKLSSRYYTPDSCQPLAVDVLGELHYLDVLR